MFEEVQDPERAGMCSKRISRIEPAMQAYVDDGLYAGISTLVFRKGALVHKTHVGYADIESAAPMDSSTLLRVYSMTKPIASTIVMTLFEEGKLRLFDPIAKYLPEFENVQVLEEDASGSHKYIAPNRPPTIRDLLTHTAGFSYHFAEDTPVAKMYDVLSFQTDSLRSLVSALSSVPLACHPGTKWHYGLNIDVAACVAEVVADKPFQDLLAERLLGPLSMNDTYFTVPKGHRSRIATMYGAMDIGLPEFSLTRSAELYAEQEELKVIDAQSGSPCDHEGFARGGHGLIMSLDDYARFTLMLLNKGQLEGERILGRRTVEFMHENHVPEKLLPMSITEDVQFLGYGQGLGSRVCLDPAAAQVMSSRGEFGWAGAAKTFYWVDPHEEMFGIFMTQKMAGLETPSNDFMNLAYQALID